jgi:hypothetical protein
VQTTASKLIAYRNELREGGVDTIVVDEMVRDAGQYLLTTYGLDVPEDEAAVAGARG